MLVFCLGVLVLSCCGAVCYGQTEEVKKEKPSVKESKEKIYRIGGDNIIGEIPASIRMSVIDLTAPYVGPKSLLDRSFRKEILQPVLKTAYEKKWGGPELKLD
jgi:hypothetical protein